MLEDRYRIDRRSTARAKVYVKRFNAAVKDAGGIIRYMAGPTFRRSEPTNTQEKEKKQ